MTPLRDRREAAAFCRCSVESFDRHVRPQLPPPRMVGRRPFWLLTWLEQWAAGDFAELSPTKAAPQQVSNAGARARSPAAERIVARIGRPRRTTARERIAAGTGTREDVEHVQKLDARYAQAEAHQQKQAKLTTLERRREEIRRSRRS